MSFLSPFYGIFNPHCIPVEKGKIKADGDGRQFHGLGKFFMEIIYLGAYKNPRKCGKSAFRLISPGSIYNYFLMTSFFLIANNFNDFVGKFAKSIIEIVFVRKLQDGDWFSDIISFLVFIILVKSLGADFPRQSVGGEKVNYIPWLERQLRQRVSLC